MTLAKLPIGIQTFSKIREDDYIYVDKTDLAYKLINCYQYVFLSRPRRFGKSLFLDTLRNIFEGNKQHFSGLAIEDKWDWDTTYPVINLNFAGGTVKSRQDLENNIARVLRNNQRLLDIECDNQLDSASCFEELIIKAYEKYQQKVVVLIDEYDKPILDNITDSEVAREVRDGLTNLYSIIKANDELLHFAFITGVSKFTKTSLFSGLNNITDISLRQDFGDICGYTQHDLETTFAEHLKGADMAMVKEWYNGYNFLGSSVYNPFDILLFISNHHIFKNYWFETGTPSFLIKLIQKNQYFLPDLLQVKATESLLDAFDINNLNFETILFQSGYLTIDSVEVDEDMDIIYTLKVPNREVRASLNEYIISRLYKDNPMNAKPLSRALRAQDVEAFKEALTGVFAGIPYHHYTNNDIHTYEGFYASIVYVYLQSLGLNIIAEDVTNKGRIDLTIKLPQAIYIIEFKVDADAASALAQIKQKGYTQKYTGEDKPIYQVGIGFDSSVKNVTDVQWEVFSN